MFESLWNRARRGARRALAVAGLGLLAAGIIAPLAGFAAAPSSTCAPADTQCVITFGNARIQERQTALSTLNSRISTAFRAGHITSADNSALVGDVAANESGLTALKGQLDSASSASVARADVKLIYTQFRIYAVVLPRDYHELWLDIVVHVDGRLVGAKPLLQDAINGAPSGVQAQANSLFSDYQTQLSTAQAQSQAARANIPQLTPANFNAGATAYETQYNAFKTDIATAHTATKQAASDLRQIVQLLKSAGISPAATPTA